ncbi:hypothetical protein PHYBLDRAFT_180889 [Phycomyces blakesleeanus NRRL 1555(-)]|uniref:Uncharacterized protein n=1 Tax=Phycomyces blakesleeanus (strain ATCC 8743b / DSM 1359 / FGSC 10004 / NBRC 33097 / NRRL 1555) TaxID=763407 RepID=A0A167MZY1_PHYB8|nr:hypothetical protein PHYBLDRAFT_180889 [Phycomyces blakesleeanus NRRL 1555(-)]OAD74634.1 hypothetical protein PHYBLDRAFT_180889 [Phycomyces blakesleeanus NRRL 1555(-)]|eukprot:XP_018292674.1 hypothetical protein PHYBLDRAFT_180889 [Phycomyces blakesleeanus NRRL 1555(-)]
MLFESWSPRAIQKLPSRNLLSTTTIRETELWSSVFDPILTTLFSDPDRDIFLRWTNVVPEEGCVSEIIRAQTDAMICEIEQLSWGCTIGYGEAKIAEPKPNIGSLANDLLRLAFVAANTMKLNGKSLNARALIYRLSKLLRMNTWIVRENAH